MHYFTILNKNTNHEFFSFTLECNFLCTRFKVTLLKHSAWINCGKNNFLLLFSLYKYILLSALDLQIGPRPAWWCFLGLWVRSMNIPTLIRSSPFPLFIIHLLQVHLVVWNKLIQVCMVTFYMLHTFTQRCTCLSICVL